MTDIRKFVIERIKAMRDHPRMWAYTKEAFVVQVALLLEIVGFQKTEDPMVTAFRVPGTNMMSGMEDQIDDEWARKFIENIRVLSNLSGNPEIS